MSKTTVSAPANIAFIKYWGARDLEPAERALGGEAVQGTEVLGSTCSPWCR